MPIFAPYLCTAKVEIIIKLPNLGFQAQEMRGLADTVLQQHSTPKSTLEIGANKKKACKQK